MKGEMILVRWWKGLISKLNDNQRVILASILVGLWSGMMAVLLKLFAHTIEKYVSRIDSSSYLYVILPFFGILLSVLFVKIFIKKGVDKGSFHVLFSIAKKSSHIPKEETYTHIITSGLTVGLGGSAGMESPIVQTGAAVGSNLSGLFPLSYRDRTLMIGCGAAAGVAAAFNAPIAGVLFALEVLLVNASIQTFIPLILAGATGALCSKIVLNEDVLFHFKPQSFDYHNVPLYFLLGILTGLFAAYHTRSFISAENLMNKVAKTAFTKLLIGGSLLILLILLFPPLFGEGYVAIKNLTEPGIMQSLVAHSILSSWITSPQTLTLFLIAILFVKVWATALTLTAGGNGGNFAPALFAGGFLGYLFADGINFLGLKQLPVHNFTLVGMAGVLCGVFRAPLTSIFLIAEITGGYDLIIPLMIVASLSLLVVRYLQPRSLDAIKLLQKGFEHTSNQDSIILSALATGNLIETNFLPVSPNASLGELVNLISQSKRNIFPVVDEAGELRGVLLLDQIREVMFKTELYDTMLVKEIQQAPPAILSFDESMASVMEKFDKTQAWNLPVVKDKQYAGFVSKSMIFSEYRKWLRENSYH